MDTTGLTQQQTTRFYSRLKAEEQRASEDEMAGWHHQFNGRELGQTSGDGEGQGGPAAVHGVIKSQTRLSD